MKKIFLLSILLCFIASSNLAIAEEKNNKGFQIAAKSDRLDKGFGTSVAKLEMILTNKAGKSITRTLEVKTMEKPNEDVGDKSITLFFTPPDIAGTALLSHAKILESDNQWLFLPEISRVKRISSSNKSGPFVGSEFAFEDLTASELNKYNYKYLDSKKIDSVMMDIVEQTPRYKRSGYTKLIAYYDQAKNLLRKIEFYNRGGVHFKTLTQLNFKNYGGTIYRPEMQKVENHLTGKSTILRSKEWKFGVILNENEFKPSSLSNL